MQKQELIALIGGGNIGISWAIVFARAGYSVRIYDTNAEALKKALPAMHDRLIQMQKSGMLEQDPASIAARVSITNDLAEAVTGAAYIQESAIEDLALKTRLFTELDTLAADDAVLASSTSSFSASSFTTSLKGRARCLVAHPANPAHILPVVELAPAPWTSETTVEKARALLTSAGKMPVILNQEKDGFIYNRLQGAVLREAYALLEEGIASTADIDRIMTFGLGLRWSVVGPFETADLNYEGGIGEHARRMAENYRRMDRSGDTTQAWSKDLVAKAEAQRRAALPLSAWPQRVEWRDQALMSMLAQRLRVEPNTDYDAPLHHAR